MFAGGWQSYVRQFMFMFSTSPTSGWDEERVNIDTGTATKELNKLIAY